MTFGTEAELHQLMLDAIQADALSEHIKDSAGLSTDVATDRHDVFPQFSIDHLSRRAAFRVGRSVLETFEMLEVLTSDKNVSATFNEVLRPDIVCVNPEQQSIVIFEFKKAAETGRQSLTELLAYEQEIKNLLPFLSNYDTNFVLVSTEWSTLMDHAVSAAITWSHRKILCLEAGLSEGKLELRTRVPEAWRVTGSVFLPEEAMPCVTICLYDKDAYTPGWTKDLTDEEKELDSRLLTALEVIAREGDRSGSHGFALLWRDWRSESLTNYNLTLGGVAPFSVYQVSRLREMLGEKDGHLVPQLDQFMKDHDPSGHSEAMMTLASAADSLLEEVANPMFEGFMPWNQQRLMLEDSAEPLLCEFWGTLGDFARNYVTHPAIRQHRRNTIRNGRGDWRDPSVGIPLIEGFMKPKLLSDGEARCSDAFHLGFLIGMDEMTRRNIGRGGPFARTLKCRFQWNRFDLMSAIDEVRLLSSATTNVTVPDEPFHFYDDPTVINDAELNRFNDWLLEQFFQNSLSHRLFFAVGYNGCICFEQRRREPWSDSIPSKYLENLEEPIRDATALVLASYRRLKVEGGLWGHLESKLERLEAVLELGSVDSSLDNISTQDLVSAWPTVLDVCDAVLPAAFHKHAPLVETTVDWTWLKQGVREMRTRGVRDAGVVLLPNGQFVTGPVSPDGMNVMNFFAKVENPDTQVLFMDRSHGFGMMRTVSWSELEDGSAYRKVALEDSSLSAEGDD